MSAPITSVEDPRVFGCGGDHCVLTAVVTDRYMEAISDALHLAKGSRMNQLRGKYVRSFDERGVHPYSEAIGRAVACIELLPDLGGDFDPRELEQAGREDAEQEWRREVLLGAVVSGEIAELEAASSAGDHGGLPGDRRVVGLASPRAPGQEAA